MLVYANHLAITGPDPTQATLRAVGGWLKEQLGFGLHAGQLTRDGEFEGNRGSARSWLRVYAAAEDQPQLYAWVLRNQDENVRGRLWITELGLKISEALVELSCVVRTEEQSTLIADPVSASQPRVIRYVVNNIRETPDSDFSTSVPGVAVKEVGADSDSYRGFLAYVDRSDRDFPIVLVSPNTENQFLVDASRLQETLFGLAQVVEVVPDFDSYEMVEVLGQRWSAWNGAINVLHMPAANGFVRGRLFLSDTIEAWGHTQHERVSCILAWVTNNTNIPRLRKRIRPEGVSQLAMRRRLQTLRDGAGEMNAGRLRQELERATVSAQEQGEWVDLLEQENNQLEEELAETKTMLDEAQSRLQMKAYEIQGIKGQLANVGEVRTRNPELEILLRLACHTDQPTPSECLDIVESFHGDRCTVLESARRSAVEISRFAQGRRLLDMLIRLVTQYRDGLLRGGDSQARMCFTSKEFAARESETVVGNKAMLQARTFEYEGERVQMLRHLKIGVDDDESKTIRVHFHWDEKKELVVIGYCGVHLPVGNR